MAARVFPTVLLVLLVVLSPASEQVARSSGILGAQGMCPRGTPDDLDHNFRFYEKGEVCDGSHPIQPIDTSLPVSERGCQLCCKNFLSCLQQPSGGQSVCTEVYQGMPCDANQAGSCGAQMTCTQVNQSTSVCLLLSSPIENGALCFVDEQCLSGRCSSGRCAPQQQTSGLGDPCQASTDCPAQSWCNASKLCGPPMPYGSPCDVSEPLPNWQCQPGSGCLFDADNNRSLCTPYLVAKKASCDPTGAWWNCAYNYVCEPSADGSDRGHCMAQPENPLKTTCRDFPFTDGDFNKCPVGATCGCFARKNVSASNCEVYINTNCVLQVTAVAACLVANHCPHDPAALIGGNPSSFAGPAVLGSCMDEHCRRKQAALLNCQNVAIASKLSPAYAPQVGPAYYEPEDTVAQWKFGLIIIGAADLTIIVLALSIITLRYKFNF